MKKIFIFLVLFFLFISATVTAQTDKDSADLITTGQRVPDFNFEIEKGKTVNINDYRGKLVLINLFATWCPPCNEELPLAQKQIWEKHKNDSHFAFLVFGREQDWATVLSFKEKKGFTFPILPDEGRKIYSLFAKQYIPRNYLVDENGKIIYQSMGYTPEEFQKLVQMIDGHLKEN